jgi:hypothetical protein
LSPAWTCIHARVVPSYISHTTVDCHDAYQLSQWWKVTLEYEDMPDDPNEPGDEECMIRDPQSEHRLLFVEVPDVDLPGKRIHFDVRPRAGSRDEEVERLRSHGATEIADLRGHRGPGSGWVVMADPEGNQFCVLRSFAEVDGGTDSLA